MKRRDVIFTFLGVLMIALALFAFSKQRVKRWSESVACGNYMSSIGFGARIWAEDNSNHLADNFLSMSNELCTPKMLICPGDKTRSASASWATFTTNNSSYQILRPCMSGDDFTNAYFRCIIHGHLGFADGTVFDGVRRKTKWPW